MIVLGCNTLIRDILATTTTGASEFIFVSLETPQLQPID